MRNGLLILVVNARPFVESGAYPEYDGILQFREERSLSVRHPHILNSPRIHGFVDSGHRASWSCQIDTSTGREIPCWLRQPGSRDLHRGDE